MGHPSDLPHVQLVPRMSWVAGDVAAHLGTQNLSREALENCNQFSRLRTHSLFLIVFLFFFQTIIREDITPRKTPLKDPMGLRELTQPASPKHEGGHSANAVWVTSSKSVPKPETQK